MTAPGPEPQDDLKSLPYSIVRQGEIDAPVCAAGPNTRFGETAQLATARSRAAASLSEKERA